MIPFKVTSYLVLSKPGKRKVYRGPLAVAQGLDAPYVTRHMLACPVRFRVTTKDVLSLSQTNSGVRLVRHFERTLGFNARILIAVPLTAFRTKHNTNKFYSPNAYQPSVEVVLHLLSGLCSRSTPSPDLVSHTPRHFSKQRGYNLILNDKFIMAAFSPGKSTLSCTIVTNIVVFGSTRRCASLVNIVTNSPNGDQVTKYSYCYAHARHDAFG